MLIETPLRYADCFEEYMCMYVEANTGARAEACFAKLGDVCGMPSGGGSRASSPLTFLLIYAYIYTYIYTCIHIFINIYRHHADDRSTPTDQQGQGRPKVSDNMIDQQGDGCRGNPAPPEDVKLKAQLQIHTGFPAC